MVKVPDRFLKLAKDPSSQLAFCNPVPEEDIEKVLEEFPNMSEQFIAFVREIGWSEDTEKFGLCRPLSGDNFNFHPSAQLYNSDAGQALFPKGMPENPDKIWNNAIVIYDTFASWRYCFGVKEGGDSVYCLDFSGPEWTEESPDFFSFIEDILSRG